MYDKIIAKAILGGLCSMKILIKNGRLVSPFDAGKRACDILIENGKIAEIAEKISAKCDKEIDAEGNYIMPGLVDIHTHGCIGMVYTRDSLDDMLAFCAGQGVTTVFPTVASLPKESMLSAIDHILEGVKAGTVGAAVGGIHLEGPFISEKKKGAMTVPDIPCTVESFNELTERGQGLIRIMTIAPEREGALDIIKEGSKRGVRMSIGHTDADYATVISAIEAGAVGSTHTFNAMSSLSHREPGAVGAVLTEDAVSCEVICDMVHLAPATVKLIKRSKGIEGMIMISDSDRITGLGEGEHIFGNTVLTVKDGVCRNKFGTIASSCFTMADGARMLCRIGFSLSEIARVGSYNPALATGLDGEVGSIEVGKRADIIITDSRMNVKRVLVRGEEAALSIPATKN